MRLGIFAKTFPRPTVEQTLQAAADAGLDAVQFNLSVLGLPTVPDTVPHQAIAATREAAARIGVDLAAISGTFNTAHPDPVVRKAGVARFPVLCETASALGIPVITLSSGSRDPQDMWRHHPDNSTAAAWSDSGDSLTALAAAATEHGVRLAVEPEHANVLATASLARLMLDEIGSPALGIVFDAANLIDPDLATPESMRLVITQAVTLLGPDIVVAHAKELTTGRRPVPAGTSGILSIGGKQANDETPKERDIAMVFQNYALYPHMTVRDNIGFALKLRKTPRTELNAKVNEAAGILGLTDWLDRKPGQLSGGQRQRVAMGRAIVRHPSVLTPSGTRWASVPITLSDYGWSAAVARDPPDMHCRGSWREPAFSAPEWLICSGGCQ